MFQVSILCSPCLLHSKQTPGENLSFAEMNCVILQNMWTKIYYNTEESRGELVSDVMFTLSSTFQTDYRRKL